MRISFCTTCRGRRADLEKTLRHNLDKILIDNEEIVLLDYNCPDGTRQWALTEFAVEIRYGILRLYSERTATRFIMSHAKNVSHLLATGEILVNLDGDNYLDPAYLSIIRSHDFQRVPMVYPRKGSGGFKGRTAIAARVFESVGGYDEAMNRGYGYEEIDLFKRLKKAGYATRDIRIDPSTVIETSEEQKVAAQLVRGTTVGYSTQIHRCISEENLSEKRYVANGLNPWGSATVYDAGGNEVRVGWINDRGAVRSQGRRVARDGPKEQRIAGLCFLAL